LPNKNSPAEMHDTAIQIQPFFLESPRGSLFCLSLVPTERPPLGGVLYLPPFAEEMHKSRRMAALQARALARAGYAVLQLDLSGCGDSGGDFGDATWDAWRDDVQLAHAWLAGQVPGAITLWGLRLGACLAVDMGAELARVTRLVLWQPVNNGEQFLNQFLRIKLASEMLSEGQAKTGTKDLLATLASGTPIEIGGYLLGSAMAQQLAKIKLAERTAHCNVEWIEVGAEAGVHLSPASQRVVDTWRAAGTSVRTQTVRGEPFWATQEISECPALLEATCAALLK
jgi:exosortase A-associated hydrolase 2